MSSERRRVGLLTGTFDPVHLGHVAMARSAMRACELDEVWFLANPTADHKQGVQPLEARVAMVRLALADEPAMREGEPNSEGEPTPHRMADFDRLMARHSERDFVFIIGSDVVSVMVGWEDYDRMLGRAEFAVAHRAGAPAAELDSRLRARTFELSEHEAASSRTIQQELAAGKRPTELDARVFTYIWERGLYRDREIPVI